jgi:hypothetical protein
LAVLRTRAMHETPSGRLSGIPQMQSAAVVGLDGYLINQLTTFSPAAVIIVDRDYFQEALNHPGAGWSPHPRKRRARPLAPDNHLHCINQLV